jgi:Arm domain-containing DNA-binding protein
MGQRRNYDRLTDRAVKAEHCDGRGLWFCVSASGARKWILRFTFNRRTHEMGLGDAFDVGIADARAKATAARRLAASGIDPIVARREGRQSAVAAKTFGECATALIKSKQPGWRSKKHAAPVAYDARKVRQARQTATNCAFLHGQDHLPSSRTLSRLPTKSESIQNIGGR